MATITGRSAVGTTGSGWLDVRSPYSGEQVGQVASTDAEGVNAAIGEAHASMSRPLPAHQRAAILDRASHLLSQRLERFAATITAESGKPIRAARVEAQRAVETLTAASTAARILAGEVVPMDAAVAGEGHLGFTLRIPVGVVGAITPFNFPLNLVAHKVSAAIAAGCTTVLKPSERTPLSAVLLRDLLDEAGLPRGWLRLVHGDPRAIVDVLIADERVRLLSFTGSAAVGWELRERAARKRVVLELGNITPAIVHGDANIEQAASVLVPAAFSFAGQTCVSVQRLFVHRSALARFLDTFVARTRDLLVGDPQSDATDIGPLIDLVAAKRLRAWVAEAIAAGATCLVGEDVPSGDPSSTLVPPVVLLAEGNLGRLATHEAFGPVVAVTPYDSIDEAITLANATDFGLQAAIFTRDIDLALTGAQRLRFGSVMINEVPSFRSDPMPYGGVKASGNSKEGPIYAAREMTEERMVVIRSEIA